MKTNINKQQLTFILLLILCLLLQCNFLFAAGYGTGGSSTTCNVSGKKFFVLIVQESNLDVNWLNLLSQYYCTNNENSQSNSEGSQTSGNSQGSDTSGSSSQEQEFVSCDQYGWFLWGYAETQHSFDGEVLTCEGEAHCISGDFFQYRAVPNECCKDLEEPSMSSYRTETINLDFTNKYIHDSNLWKYQIKQYLDSSESYINLDGTFTEKYSYDNHYTITGIAILFENDMSESNPIKSIYLIDNNNNKTKIYDSTSSNIYRTDGSYSIQYYFKVNQSPNIQYIEITYNNQNITSYIQDVLAIAYDCTTALTLSFIM